MIEIDLTPELTIFSHNNFSIIGRSLALATSYEKSMKTLLLFLSIKNPAFFVDNIKAFNRIKNKRIIDDIKTKNKIIEVVEKLSFHKVIDILLKQIINNVDLMHLYEMFIQAKDVRNFIAHELCVDFYDFIDTDVFRKYLTTEFREKLLLMIDCMIIAEQWISSESKESTIADQIAYKYKVVDWALETID